MQKDKQFHAFLLLVILCSFLVGCGAQQSVTTLDGATKEAVLAYSEAKTDGLLSGLNKNDYAMFSKDFDKDMLNAMSQTAFTALKTDSDAKRGAYISREVKQVVEQGDFYAVIYDAKFEKEDLTMRVVFRIAEPHQVSGWWFTK